MRRHCTQCSAMKRWTFLLAFSVLLGVGTGRGQTPVWPPSSGETQVPIWPSAIPDAQPAPGSEMVKTDSNFLVADKRVIGVYNVTRPTMTLYAPKRRNTDAAVVVFPGGGFAGLAIDLEGTEVCDWLTSRGITCVLLKYRVPSVPYDWHCDCRPNGLAISTPSLEDAQRTVGLVRAHAAEWHVDPGKIGVLGFSAGGYLVAEISTHFEHRLYPPVDAADGKSCRPDFAVAIYPGHLWMDDRLKLNPRVPVTSQTPPTFLLQAEDDPVDSVMNSLVYYAALKEAGVPVEMHLYALGGHAFGLRRTKFPITGWTDLVETWLRTIGMTGE